MKTTAQTNEIVLECISSQMLPLLSDVIIIPSHMYF